MLKMSRLSPQVKALEAKYGDDKQKYQLAVQQMYKEEGVSMGGGCLWSFIPLLILLPLYYVIREPITYMMHNSRSISEAIVAFLQASGENLGKNAYYAQLAAAGHIGDYADKLREVLQSIMGSDVKINLQAMNFQFLGIDLAAIPTFRFWDCEGWSEIGLFLIPVVSAGLQAVSMWISQKMNNQVATNADGRAGCGRRQDRQPDQRDHDAHDAAHVPLDRLLHARRDLHLLDRAGRVRRCAGLFSDEALPQGL